MTYHFKSYTPKPTGRKGLGTDISINKNQISLGTVKPPFEYLRVEYDTDACAIRFSEGDRTNGFKVSTNRNSQPGYYINALHFVNKGYLPLGRYQKVAELTYKQTPPESKPQ